VGLTPAEKQKRYRERQKFKEGVLAQTELSEEQKATFVDLPEVELAGPPEDDEQAIRDFWGYAKSETWTKAERDAAAARIMAKAGLRSEALTKERYVEDAVRAARSVNMTGDKRDREAEAGREQRAAEYAAWRWDGFHRGEIASL